MKDLRKESGYALLLMLLMLLGAGGVVLAGLTQQARQETEQQRYLHNQQVLKEAKQALLMYAYNYPDNNPLRGPGRLPCPDTDLPGAPGEGAPNTSFNCINGTAMVGRFPWKDADLGFYDARDASGERLWYAVSRNFANTISPTTDDVINSNTAGTITLVDRSGQILYNGAVEGIAAVIIAPGPIVRRDENGDGSYEYVQIRQTAAQQADPRNYLDTFGDFDNSSFANGSNADADSFILGPVFDAAAGDIVVNDQFIVVTADEILDMAEKKVLETYRDTIRAYLDNTGGVYPWLYSYDGVEYDLGGGEPVSVAIDKLSTFFPALSSFATEKTDYLGIDPDPAQVPPRGHMGRIPSIFGSYFTEGDSRPIETRLVNMEISLIDSAAPDVWGVIEKVCDGGCPGETWDVTTFYRAPVGGAPKISVNIGQVLTDVKFVDVNPNADDGRVRLSARFGSPGSPVTLGPYHVYFYNNDHSPVYTYWTACGGGADELMDCSRDSSGNLTPGATNDYRSRILHMEVYIEFDGTEAFEFDLSTPLPNPVAPATSNPQITAANGSSHATITATLAAANIVSFPGTITATYEYNRHFHENDTSLSTGNTYTTGDIDLTGATISSLKLGLRYYPELPAWTYSNRWHDYIRMVYAFEYQPGEPLANQPCDPGVSCMELTDSAGSPQAIALLVLAGKGEWQDGPPPDVPNGRLRNDLDTVFDPSNDNFNRTFYRRNGNDKLMVIY